MHGYLLAEGGASDPRYAEVAGRIEGRELGRRWPLRKPFPACFVAEEEHELVGYVSMFAREGMSATIEELYVGPYERSRGIGRSLVRAIVGAAESAGYREFQVGTLALDTRAIAFWRAMGFGDWWVTLRRDVGP